MQTTTDFKPKYAHLKFETEELFQAWLADTAVMEIELEDHGQDLTNLWLSEEGEVLHCAFGQQQIWVGRFIDLEYLTEGHPISMNDFENREEWEVMENLIIERVAYLKG